VNKQKYFKEVEELISTSKNSNVERADFEILYLVVTGKNTEVDGCYISDKIVNSLFHLFGTQVLISWDFLQTEVGRALIKAKFEIGNDIYFMEDLVNITGFTKQYISKQVKEEKIKGEKRKGFIYFRENEVNKFLVAKNKPDLIKNKKQYVYEEVKETLINGGFEREVEYK
jgi:hypothetical protein